MRLIRIVFSVVGLVVQFSCTSDTDPFARTPPEQNVPDTFQIRNVTINDNAVNTASSEAEAVKVAALIRQIRIEFENDLSIPSITRNSVRIMPTDGRNARVEDHAHMTAVVDADVTTQGSRVIIISPKSMLDYASQYHVAVENIQSGKGETLNAAIFHFRTRSNPKKTEIEYDHGRLTKSHQYMNDDDGSAIERRDFTENGELTGIVKYNINLGEAVREAVHYTNDGETVLGYNSVVSNNPSALLTAMYTGSGQNLVWGDADDLIQNLQIANRDSLQFRLYQELAALPQPVPWNNQVGVFTINYASLTQFDPDSRRVQKRIEYSSLGDDKKIELDLISGLPLLQDEMVTQYTLFTYNETGQLVSTVLFENANGNGKFDGTGDTPSQVTIYEYTENKQPAAEITTNANVSQYFGLVEYTYDNNGNRLSRTAWSATAEENIGTRDALRVEGYMSYWMEYDPAK